MFFPCPSRNFRLCRAALDAFFVTADNHVMHVYTRGVNLVGAQRPNVDELFHLRNSDATSHSAQWIEVTCREPILKVAQSICAPGFHHCPVGADTPLENVLAPIEIPHLLLFSANH